MEGDPQKLPGQLTEKRTARSSSTNIWILIAVWALVYFVLYLVSTTDYVVFHSLIELSAIAIAFAIFIIAWNARSSINGYFLILSIGFLFMGFVDLLHTLAYPGMIVFDNINLDIPTQLWIVARTLQAGTMILAALAVRRKGLNPYAVFFAYLIVTSVLVWSVWARYFPTTYLAGTGLTTFKVVAEYVISAAFLLSAYLLYRNRQHLDRKVYTLMTASIGLAIASELLFSNYLAVNSFTNMMGHMLKLAEFYLIYLAVIKISINDPFRTLFKEVSDSEKRYHTIVDAANSLIIGLNHEGKVTLLNPSAEKLTRYREEDVLGDSFIERLVPEKDRSEAIEIFSQVSKGTASDWQMPIQTADGERTIWWHNATIPRNDGDHYLFIGLDVTEREAMTNRLEELNQTMEMVHKIVLHDMKNELGIISVSLGRYKRKNDPEMLELASQAVARGRDLMERMWEVEQLTSAGSTTRPIDVAEVVEKVFSQRKNPNVIFERSGDSVRIIGDDTFIIAIDNLVKNALTHADPSKIEISVADCGDLCQITVRDDGRGIPSEVKQRVFEEGFRYGNTGNTGMGLYIVSKVMERHHGSVDILDNHPQGTSFVLTVPKGSADPQTVSVQ
jgi:PAS domain S-box-containing protein